MKPIPLRSAPLCIPLFVICAVLPGAGLAQDQRPPEPPPEAFRACAGRAARAACAVDFNGMHIEGTCDTWPDRRLFCRPAGMPPGPPPR